MTYNHARKRWLAALQMHMDAAEAYSMHLESLIRMSEDDFEPGGVAGAIFRVEDASARIEEARRLALACQDEMMRAFHEAISPGAAEHYREAMLDQLDRLCPPEEP